MRFFGKNKKAPNTEKTCSTDYESLLALAAALEAKGDCVKARDKYEQAIKADHERPTAYVEAAKMILRHGGIWEGNKLVFKVDLAERYIEDALSWSQDDLQCLEVLFSAQMYGGKLHRAVQTASKLVDLSSDKSHWQEQGRRTFETLRQTPMQMNFLVQSVGTGGIDILIKKFSE